MATREFNSEITAGLGWDWIQGAVDNSQLRYTKQIIAIADDLQVEGVWHDESRVLTAGSQDLFDLGRLVRSVLRSPIVTPFILIKAIEIVNLSSGGSAGTLIIGNAPFDGWWEPFGAVNQTVEVPPNSPLMLVNRDDGWPVQGVPDSSSSSGGGADAQRILRIAAIGGSVTYSIAIIGTLSQPSDSSSSSSSSG